MTQIQVIVDLINSEMCVCGVSQASVDERVHDVK